MKKSFLFFIAILSLIIFTSSCGKKEMNLEAKIARYWKYDVSKGNQNLDSTSYLSIKPDKYGVKRFIFNKNGNKNIGTWKVIDSINQLILSYPIQNTGFGVDSVYQIFDENGIAETVFLKENDIISTLKNGKVSPKVFIQKFEIITSENGELHLDYITSNVTHPRIFAFKYESKVLKTRFSVTSILRGLLGIFGLIFITFLFSSNKKAINWSLVIKGLSLQLLLAIGVLYVPFVTDFFNALSLGFIKLISFTDDGIDFVFRSFVTGQVEGPLINFAFKILPTIIFFSAITSMLYYLGILQKVVWGLAWAMKKIMKLSGAESLAAAGNIFLGQTESPFLIKPYLDKMTKSELMCLMTGGMATIAGGVLAAYIGFLGGDDPEQSLFFAKHLLTASIMSAPAAVVAAKILVPETETVNQDMSIPKEKLGSNILEAITNGSTDGLKLAVNVGVMLLVFTAIVFMGNWMLGDIVGHYTGINELIADANNGYDKLSFQFILGYLFAPLAGLMGIDNWHDMLLTGQLLGEKTILNEFYAYSTFGDLKSSFHSEKSVVMVTYMLCGFANFASIGVQIGGIGALIPGRKGTLSKLGVKALVGGTVASLLTAVVIGMFL